MASVAKLAAEMGPDKTPGAKWCNYSENDIHELAIEFTKTNVTQK